MGPNEGQNPFLEALPLVHFRVHCFICYKNTGFLPTGTNTLPNHEIFCELIRENKLELCKNFATSRSLLEFEPRDLLKIGFHVFFIIDQKTSIEFRQYLVVQLTGPSSGHCLLFKISVGLFTCLVTFIASSETDSPHGTTVGIQFFSTSRNPRCWDYS